MAWTNILNSVLLVDKPWTSAIATAFRDNLAAVAGGLAGAPRIVGDAHASLAVGAVVQRNCLPTGSVSSSSLGITNDRPVVTDIYSSFATAIVPCVVRVVYSTSGTGPDSVLEISRNGTPVTSVTANVTDATVDVTLAAGDCIGVRAIATTRSDSHSVRTVTKLQYTVSGRSAGLI